jgi:anti-sigma factor RsiW
MNCEDVRLRLDAYFDGELDSRSASEVRDHLDGCAECKRRLAEIGQLSQQIRQFAPRPAAPTSLRVSIGEIGGAPVNRSRRAWVFGSGALSGVCASILGFAVYLNLQRKTQFIDEVVSDHVRSLAPGHLIDVVSSDRHTVKPWFLGRIDFAPTVPDLAASGFPLQGGRLEYLSGRQSAALIYLRGKHVINVFVLPKASAPSIEGQKAGYQVEAWDLGDLRYIAVSDVARPDLDLFVTDFRLAAK